MNVNDANVKKRIFNYNISTITSSGCLGVKSINLFNVGKYLEINDRITGIKYTFGNKSILKGVYTTSVFKKSKNKNYNKINQKLFYNQISIIYETSNKLCINVKLFANGSYHMTGVKEISDIKDCINYLVNCLTKLECTVDLILLVPNQDNVLLDSSNMIYTYTEPKTIIGYLDPTTNFYVINNKNYTIDNYTKMFKSVKIETKRKNMLLDLNGNEIGYTQIELMKNKFKLYKKNSNIHFDTVVHSSPNDSDPKHSFIYYDSNYTSIIGKVNYHVNVDDLVHVTHATTEYNYIPYATETTETIKTIKTTIDINCINIYFDIGFKINRSRLFKSLLEHSFICEYKPEKYSGVKLIYKYTDKYTGHCECDQICICRHVTFLIFQSGNVIVSGFKGINSIEPILKNFSNYLDNEKNIIKRKELPC